MRASLKNLLAAVRHCQRTRLLKLADAVEAVEGGYLITLGKRGVVEDGIDEIIELAAKRHDRLADVHELAGTFADDVDAKDGVGDAVEDEFETAGGIAADLASGNFTIVGDANLVGDVLFGKLLFGFCRGS